MKQSINTSLVFLSGLIVSSLFVSQAILSQRTNKAQAEMQTVTIVAQRMTEAQRMAYDQETAAIPTVVISAKRLSPEQKLAMDAQTEEQHLRALDEIATQEIPSSQAGKI